MDWCGFYGYRPELWAEYLIGLRLMTKERERAKLRLASAVRMGVNAEGKVFDNWRTNIDLLVN